MKVKIIGTRGKIGKELVNQLSPHHTLVDSNDDADVIFIASSTVPNDLSAELIIDLTGKSRNGQINSQSYAPNYEPMGSHISNRTMNLGCSSLAVLHAIYPLAAHIDNKVFVDVKFSRSALQHDSKNLKTLNNNIVSAYIFKHPHKSDIETFMPSISVNIAPHIIDIDRGLQCTIFGTTDINLKSILTSRHLNSSNVSIVDQVNLDNVVGTSNIEISIDQDGDSFCIDVAIDNIVLPVSQAIKIANNYFREGT